MACRCAWSASGRPSSRPAALSQCGTIFALRMSNERDQALRPQRPAGRLRLADRRPAGARHRRGRGRRRGRVGADADPVPTARRPTSSRRARPPPSAAPGRAKSPTGASSTAPSAAGACSSAEPVRLPREPGPRLAAPGHFLLHSPLPSAPGRRAQQPERSSLDARQDLPARRGRGPHLCRSGRRRAPFAPERRSAARRPSASCCRRPTSPAACTWATRWTTRSRTRWSASTGCAAADVLWQPGTDHAGIATQMVVERAAGAPGGNHRPPRDGPRGVRRQGLGVEGAVRRHDRPADAPARRLAATGAASASPWTRACRAAVRKAFVALHKAGPDLPRQAAGQLGPAAPDGRLRPRGAAAARSTAISGTSRYPARGRGPAQLITVATTRPETMLGDTGVAVHPDDERYRHLHRQARASCRSSAAGSRSSPTTTPTPRRAPARSRSRPAHDFNDFEVGRRHGLTAIPILDELGRINDNAPEAYRGLDRFEARRRVVAELEALGLLEQDREATATPCRTATAPARRSSPS